MSDSNFASVAFLLLPKAAGAVPATDRCGNALTAVDNAAFSADASALSGYSLLLDGSGDWVSTPGSSALNLGSGSKTIDFRFSCTGTSKAVLEYVDASSVGWRVWVSSTGYLEFYSNSTLLKVGSTLVNNGGKHHCALVWNGTAMSMYIDGVAQGGSITDTNTYAGTPPILSIGARVTSRNPGLDLPGNIDFVRITPGVARWLAGFTPPTLADVAPQYAVSIQENMGISADAARVAKFGAEVSELANFSGKAIGALHGIIAETMNFSGSADRSALKAAAITEMISLSGVVAVKSILQGGVVESVSLSETVNASARLSVTAVEGFRIFEAEALYSSLDDLVSVWVANAATAAHSRYAQYGFNSFARFGGKHYGCKSDGIYELNGDLDGTDPIKWTATLPETDLGMDEIKRLPYVYIGAKASGNLVLKVIKGPGQVYHFDVVMSGREDRAGRARLAKGLEGRYWRLEIASDTERVELDSIEFHPVKVFRRV